MPLQAPIDRRFSGGTVGQPVPTPSGVTLNGTQPTYEAYGSTTAGLFDPASGTASYWRETIPAANVDSDAGQLTVDFILRRTPTSNCEAFLLAGSGAILTSALITTARTLLMRDASSSSQVAGWTAPTLALDTPYRMQQAVLRGTSGSYTTTGTIKAQLIRLSDGVVLATGLADGNGNAGSVQCNGALVAKRTAAGQTGVSVISYRVSNQATDYLGDLPPQGGGTTFVPGANAVLGIGDSTTDRSGAGPSQVAAAVVNNGQGWTAEQVLINGLTSRTINYDNGVHPNGVEQIDVFRNANQDSRTWFFMLGGNGGASDLAQQKTWLSQLLAKVASGPRTDYRVLLVGFARQDPANADAARFWQAISETVAPSGVTLTKFDYNSALHNGRSETGLWQSTSPTEAHMTASGYSLRDSLIAPQVTKASTTTPPPTAAPQVAEGSPSTFTATTPVRKAQQAEGSPAAYTATQPTRAPQAAEGASAAYTATGVTRTPQTAEGSPSTYTATTGTAPARTPQASEGVASTAYVATQPTQPAVGGPAGWGIRLVLKPFPSGGGGGDASVFDDTYTDTF